MVYLVYKVLDVLIWIIIADAVLSWFQRDTRQFPRRITNAVTTPIYAPIHAILNPRMTGGIDFSPLVVIFLLGGLQRLLVNASFGF